MHPRRADTDHDGIRDGREDTDGDGLRTAFEFRLAARRRAAPTATATDCATAARTLTTTAS